MGYVQSQDHYPFSPNLILVTGLCSFAFLIVLGSSFFWWVIKNNSSFDRYYKNSRKEEVASPQFSFSLIDSKAPFEFPIPKLDAELCFVESPIRPGSDQEKKKEISLFLKRSNEIKKTSLPGRVGLCYEEGVLHFKEEDRFVLDLSEKTGGQVVLDFRIDGLEEKIRSIKSVQKTAICNAKELPEGTAFRLLSEAKWLGRNLVKEKVGGKTVFVLSVGDQLLEICPQDFLGFSAGSWKVIEGGSSLDDYSQIARIEQAELRSFVMEGWDGKDHLRFSFPLHPSQPMHFRAEEMFSALRIRSEKQISCMLDKQCFILRVGDLVLKTAGKWKVLRSAEEKENYLLGKVKGELFLFEKIESRQGQKWMEGTLFNADKTEGVPIKIAALQSLVQKERGRS